MHNLDKSILDRINYLLTVGGPMDINRDGGVSVSSEVAREVYAGTLSIISKIYGSESPQAIAANESNSRIMPQSWAPQYKNGMFVLELRGILANIKAEIQSGLLSSIRQQAKGEILADFIFLAKDAIDNGAKDVAAVLSCAALEDSLKRYAEMLGIEVEDKNLSEVINVLKASSVLPGPQAKVIQSFVGLRNKAMHAEWDKIDTSEVHSIIGFVQDFVAKRFN